MRINIGVTGTGSLIGQGIIKCIVRSEYAKDYTLIGFDYFNNTVGSFWCSKNFILPDLLKPGLSEQWVAELERLIIEHDIRILFAGVDFELPVLAKNKARIESNTNCIVVVSSEKVIEIGNDKYLTYEFLRKNNLYYPETYLPENCDISALNYPQIVKPRIGARSIGVHKVKNIEELKKAVSNVNGPIIQELVGNDQTEYTCGVISFNGELKHSIVLKRSLKDGNTFISEHRNDFPPIIYSYIKEIAEKLGPFGACNFQLRIDENGFPKLFEINPRHSGTTYMRFLFGYNEIIFMLKYLLENIEIPFTLTEGMAIRHFEETLVS